MKAIYYRIKSFIFSLLGRFDAALDAEIDYRFESWCRQYDVSSREADRRRASEMRSRRMEP